MATQRSIVEDRGSVSRISVRLSCRFTFKGIQHEGIIHDISLGGAFLSSTFTPPLGTRVSIKLDAYSSSKPITLEAKVVRRDYKIVERGSEHSFAVTFNQNGSPEFTRFLDKLLLK